ncbi:MAG: penicillin acylase family protein [Vicinamibacteria bacterium]
MRALRRRRVLRTFATCLLLIVVLVGLAATFTLRGSLPTLDGKLALSGLKGAVTIERDANGVATVSGSDRIDVARATGFLHGQERFFQMDLMRRRAAGELSELIGAATVPVDEDVRIHQFRRVAQESVALFSPQERALTNAYVEGVNAGLNALRVRPYEYVLLRADPAAWKAEDSVLCVLAMFLTLHESRGEHENTLAVMRDALPPALFDFLAPRGTEWDAPIQGDPIVNTAIPGSEIIDLRGTLPLAKVAANHLSPDRIDPEDNLSSIGSNNWAVDAAHSVNGQAMVADDMHLEITVPNIWYRIRLRFPDADGKPRTVTGVSLPGAAGIVAGSNGHVAWGFTNTEGDWNDLVVIEPGVKQNTYLTADGPKEFERSTETIQVKGAPARTLEVLNTIWGPVLHQDHNRPLYAYQWTAHDPHAVNLKLLDIESANTLEEAIEAAHNAGAPPQNAMLADSTGRIAWTVAGRIPNRVGFEGRLPVTRSDPSRRWDGYVASADVPTIVDPADGKLWTANARVVSGPMLAIMGEGRYALGARARQIRDDLRAKEKLSASDMMDIQLDNRAVFLDRWQKLALATLDDATIGSDPLLKEAKGFITNWGAHASVDSVGFRIVRAFRLATSDRVFAPLIAPALKLDPAFRYNRMWQSEGPLWAMVTNEPMHLLDPKYADWKALRLDAMKATIADLTKDGRKLAERTWGERNAARIQHPLSRAVPALSKYLDMKHDPLPGDENMPRVHTPTNGASERFVVSPGHEDQGFFHMPSGQTSHPLSPYFGAGHEAWLKGEKTPFLPGPARYTLILDK